MSEKAQIGNAGLMGRRKVGFMCSRQVSSMAVLPCYDWATGMLGRDEVVVSGFQSKIEKDVLNFLLQGKQPVILVLARQLYKTLPQELQAALEEDRLLIIGTAPEASRVSKSTADARNAYIANIADSIVFGYIREDSDLRPLYLKHANKSKILFSK